MPKQKPAKKAVSNPEPAPSTELATYLVTQPFSPRGCGYALSDDEREILKRDFPAESVDYLSPASVTLQAGDILRIIAETSHEGACITSVAEIPELGAWAAFPQSCPFLRKHLDAGEIAQLATIRNGIAGQDFPQALAATLALLGKFPLDLSLCKQQYVSGEQYPRLDSLLSIAATDPRCVKAIADHEAAKVAQSKKSQRDHALAILEAAGLPPAKFRPVEPAECKKKPGKQTLQSQIEECGTPAAVYRKYYKNTCARQTLYRWIDGFGILWGKAKEAKKDRKMRR